MRRPAGLRCLDRHGKPAGPIMPLGPAIARTESAVAPLMDQLRVRSGYEGLGLTLSRDDGNFVGKLDRLARMELAAGEDPVVEGQGDARRRDEDRVVAASIVSPVRIPAELV